MWGGLFFFLLGILLTATLSPPWVVLPTLAGMVSIVGFGFRVAMWMEAEDD